MASHINGAVERVIRSVKQALTIVLHGQVLTPGALTTSLAVVEATLNYRPLTTPSNDTQESDGYYSKFLPYSKIILVASDC